MVLANRVFGLHYFFVNMKTTNRIAGTFPPDILPLPLSSSSSKLADFGGSGVSGVMAKVSELERRLLGDLSGVANDGKQNDPNCSA